MWNTNIFFLQLLKLVCKNFLRWVTFWKKKIHVCIPRSFLVINVCDQGNTLCSPSSVARAFQQYIHRCKVIKSAVDIFNTTEHIHGLFSLYLIRHSKNFLGIMWNGPKSEENCEMFAQSYAVFALCTMTVKYEELTSTKNYGKRKHCLMLLPGSLSSPNRRLTDVY